MLVFNIFGSLAQFERDLIRERTHAGLKAARDRGNKGGRRPVVTPDKLRKARAHIAAGLTVREAAARLKIGKTALYKALEQNTPCTWELPTCRSEERRVGKGWVSTCRSRWS